MLPFLPIGIKNAFCINIYASFQIIAINHSSSRESPLKSLVHVQKSYHNYYEPSNATIHVIAFLHKSTFFF